MTVIIQNLTLEIINIVQHRISSRLAFQIVVSIFMCTAVIISARSYYVHKVNHNRDKSLTVLLKENTEALVDSNKALRAAIERDNVNKSLLESLDRTERTKLRAALIKELANKR